MNRKKLIVAGTFLSALIILSVTSTGVSESISIKTLNTPTSTKTNTFFPKNKKAADTLTIYAYDSLLAYGENKTDTHNKVFQAFGDTEGVEVKLVLFDGAGAALAKAILEKDNPVADVIIGIDNLRIFEAKKAGVLTPYTPDNFADIFGTDPHNLTGNLDPEHYILPYEFGLISLVYQKAIINETVEPLLGNLNLSDLLLGRLCSKMIVEDPILSSTGLGFFLWTIAVYEKILNLDWATWWEGVRGCVNVQKSWSDAYELFFIPEAGRPIVVSYGNDGAFSYFFYDDTSVDTLFSHENGTTNGWLQMQGLGIVKGTPRETLAKKFVKWFLGAEVQKEIAENEWMYPANPNVELPASYEYAVDPSDIFALNQLMTVDEINNSLKDWQKRWEEGMLLGFYVQSSATTDTGTSAAPGISFGLAMIAIVVLPLIRKLRFRSFKRSS